MKRLKSDDASIIDNWQISKNRFAEVTEKLPEYGEELVVSTLSALTPAQFMALMELDVRIVTIDTEIDTRRSTALGDYLFPVMKAFAPALRKWLAGGTGDGSEVATIASLQERLAAMTRQVVELHMRLNSQAAQAPETGPESPESDSSHEIQGQDPKEDGQALLTASTPSANTGGVAGPFSPGGAVAAPDSTASDRNSKSELLETAVNNPDPMVAGPVPAPGNTPKRAYVRRK